MTSIDLTNSESPQTSSSKIDADVKVALVAEERDGYRLSIKGRMYALAVISVLMFFLTPFPGVLYFHGLIACFAITGLLAGYCQNQSWFRPWQHYSIVLAEFALLTFTVIFPNPFVGEPYPPQITYQNGNAIYLFVLLVGLAFSYRPKMVLWGGLAGAICWAVGLLWMLSLPETISVMTIGSEKFNADPYTYLTQATYVDMGVRLQELVVFVIIAGLIAATVYRSRRLVLKQVTAERDRSFVREALGKYVPVSVANAIVADQGALQPQRQTATMLFCDMEGFTALVERTDPADVFTLLNEYFAALGAAVVAEGGVINQFQGDAILATFNLPVEDTDHADAAVRAALAIRNVCEARTFAGQSLRARTGIATGEVIAGSVGSGSQLAYTVHGDAVNMAARLEQMNKQTGTTILIAESTFEAVKDRHNAEHMGKIPIRGHADASVYTV
jgi:class 3 adenylate cyclase